MKVNVAALALSTNPLRKLQSTPPSARSPSLALSSPFVAESLGQHRAQGLICMISTSILVVVANAAGFRPTAKGSFLLGSEDCR